MNNIDVEELAQRLVEDQFLLDKKHQEVLLHLKHLADKGKLDMTRRGLVYEDGTEAIELAKTLRENR